MLEQRSRAQSMRMATVLMPSVCSKKTDKHDKYLIYRLNNDTMNNVPTSIFKSSKSTVDLAISMDRETGQNRKSYVHVDVKHDRVHGLQSRCGCTTTQWEECSVSL